QGGDGGSIPGRADLVKLKTRGVKLDQTELLIAQWFFCALSKNNLQPPIVACGLGKLYNRDAVIEYLLDKDRYGEADVICPHIHSIKDVINLNLTMNPAYDEPAHGHTNPTSTTAQFICPITGKEMNGKYRFVFLDSCGCVFSEQALKEVKTSLCMKVSYK
ncbi:Rtf2 RING-finger-domain-containing protein, partial [Paraphysoderma sedebokerense]